MALAFQKKSIKIQETTRSLNDLKLSTPYNNIALTYMSLDSFDQAIYYNKKAIDIREKTLHPFHPYLAISYNSMASCQAALGKYKEAILFQEKDIHIKEKTLPDTHSSLAISYANLASYYSELKQFEKALTLQIKASEILEKEFESTHIALVTCYNNIAITYQKLNKHEKAVDFQLKVIHILEEIKPVKQPYLAIAYNNLGLSYQNLEKYEKALEYQKRGISIQEKHFGLNHSSLALSYHNIAHTYYFISDYKNAIKFQQKSVTIYNRVLPDGHPHRQKAMNALTDFIYDRGLNNYIDKNFTKALEDFTYVYQHRTDSDALYYAGVCFEYLHDYPAAIEAYQKALTISPDIKEKHFFNNIGIAYAKNKQFHEAENAFTEYEKLFPNEGRPYRNWAMYFALQNKKQQAIKKLEKAIYLGYNDIEWLQTDDSLDNIRDEEMFQKLIRQLEEKQTQN